MARARRLMRESLPLVDAVAELRDARAPESSRNPELQTLIGEKPRIVLLNKSDLADEDATAQWLRYLRGQSVAALAVNSRSGQELHRFVPLVTQVLAPVIERNAAKGMAGRALRLMVVGIPNTGKSSFINRLTRHNRAAVADHPGVTRRNQWYVAGDMNGVHIELLDTPGVLWPKFEDESVGRKLAFLGAVKDEIIDGETLAIQLCEVLQKAYLPRVTERYKLTQSQDELRNIRPWELLALIARKRGMLIAGGEPDLTRVSVMLLDETRAGKLGRLTLDAVPNA